MRQTSAEKILLFLLSPIPPHQNQSGQHNVFWGLRFHHPILRTTNNPTSITHQRPYPFSRHCLSVRYTKASSWLPADLGPVFGHGFPIWLPVLPPGTIKTPPFQHPPPPPSNVPIPVFSEIKPSPTPPHIIHTSPWSSLLCPPNFLLNVTTSLGYFSSLRLFGQAPNNS